MKRWPRSASWWRPKRASGPSGSFAAALLSFALLTVLSGLAALRADSAEPRPLTLAGRDRADSVALIIALDQTTWSDLRRADLPHLADVLAHSAVGLMPVAAASDADPHRTWVTLGAGRTAVASGHLTSRSAPAGAGLVLDADSLLAANRRARTRAHPGMLGSRLHAAGLSTAAIVPRPQGRSQAAPSLAIIMDRDGSIDEAWPPAALLTPAGAAHIVDPHALQDALIAALASRDVVLVDLGSSVSLDRQTARAGTLPELTEDVIGAAAAALAGRRALLAIICGSSPASPDPQNRSLGCIALCQLGPQPPPGLLTSAATRWDGLVTAADFAPTLLNWWGLPLDPRSAGPAGRAMEVVPTSDHLRRLDRLDEILGQRYRLRFAAVACCLCCAFALILVALALALWRPRGIARLGGFGIALALAPLGLLVSPLVGLAPAWYHLLVAALITAILARAAAGIERPAPCLAAMMLFGAILIAGDTLLGSALMRRSPLGFGVMFGSRFYGIGNEYMGVLAAMTALGLGAALGLGRRAARAALLVAIAVVLAIGAPWWGANWGGSFAAASGLVALWLFAGGRRARWMPALAAALLLTSVLLPAALDLLRPPAHRSHIGVAAASLLSEGPRPLLDIAQRKLSMSLGVLQRAPWSPAGLLLVASLLWALLRRGGPARRALETLPGLKAGIAGALIAAAVAAVVNDSGLVAAAGALAVVVGAVILLAARAPEAAQ